MTDSILGLGLGLGLGSGLGSGSEHGGRMVNVIKRGCTDKTVTRPLDLHARRQAW